MRSRIPVPVQRQHVDVRIQLLRHNDTIPAQRHKCCLLPERPDDELPEVHIEAASITPPPPISLVVHIRRSEAESPRNNFGIPSFGVAHATNNDNCIEICNDRDSLHNVGPSIISPFVNGNQTNEINRNGVPTQPGNAANLSLLVEEMTKAFASIKSVFSENIEKDKTKKLPGFDGNPLD